MADTPPQDVRSEQQIQQDELNTILHDKDRDSVALANEPYRGASESLSALARGLLFGVPAYFIGQFIGDIGDFNKKTRPERYTGYKGKVFGGAMAVGAFFMAARKVGQEVKEGKAQVKRLQQEVGELYEKSEELKSELKRQLTGEGVLDHYDEEWEKGTPAPAKVMKADAPGTLLNAADVTAHEVAESKTLEISG